MTALKQNNYASPKPVTLFYRLLKAPIERKLTSEKIISNLRVTLIAQKGILYLKVKGFADSIHIKELKKALKGQLPHHYSQMVVNTEGVQQDLYKTVPH